MKRFVSLFTLLLSVVALLPATPENGKPNFIFILADDMGWTGTSVQLHDKFEQSQSDYYQTPNIARLAQHGMTFSHAYAPAPLCTPSRAAILTGKTPAELHITSPGRGRALPYHKLVQAANRTELKALEITIAELLSKNGYTTAHFGKWHLGRSNPGNHGFDEHDGSTANNPSDNTSGENPKDIFGVTKRAIAFIEEQTASQTPFYVQLSHYAVHSPTEARKESIQKFDSIKTGRRHKDSEFAAMTWDLDQSIGKLLAKVDELELAANTYLIFMSDNGAAANPRSPQNAPLNGGKGSLYEGGIRVPFIVQGPEIEAASHSNVPVIGYDLYPTISELAGINLDHEIAGKSLANILKNAAPAEESVRGSLYFHYPHYGRGPRQKPQSAIISGRYKLIKDWESGRVELYDLDQDIVESNNLASEKPEIAKKLSTQLTDWLGKNEAQIPSPNPDYDPSATPRGGRRQQR